MRRSKTQSLAQVLKDYIAEMRIGRKLREVSVVESWEKVAGRAIASKTTSVYMREGVLHIRLKSSVVKNELLMLREDIRKRLNEEAGDEIVREIVIH